MTLGKLFNLSMLSLCFISSFYNGYKVSIIELFHLILTTHALHTEKIHNCEPPLLQIFSWSGSDDFSRHNWSHPYANSMLQPPYFQCPKVLFFFRFAHITLLNFAINFAILLLLIFKLRLRFSYHLYKIISLDRPCSSSTISTSVSWPHSIVSAHRLVLFFH